MIALPAFLALLGLGTWQLERLEWKAELIDFRRSQLAAPPAPLPADLANAARALAALEYRRVAVTGVFVHDREIFLAATRRGRAGFHVITPLRRDGGSPVLVNRGWVPTGPSREVLPKIGAPRGELQVIGKLFPPPRVFLLGSSGYEGGGWPLVVQSVDTERMEKLLGYAILSSVVMLAPDAPDGYTRQWTPYYGITPQRHKAYAFQWFSLATALLIIYIAMTVRRVKGNDE